MKMHTIETLESRRLLAAHIVGSTAIYSTIQAAVNAASAGAVITVDAGTYNEEVFVNKQLDIRGAQSGLDARTRNTSNESIVDGVNNSGVTSAGFYISANDATIDGFTVQGETNQSTSVGAGIVIAPGVSGTHIINNIVQNNVAGIYLTNSSSTDAAVMQYNLFQNNNNNGVNGGRGIYTDGGISGGNLTNVIIDSNTFTQNYGASGTTTTFEAAIAFEASNPGEQSNITITNNTFNANGKAVLFFNTTNVLFKGNTVTNQTDTAGSVRFEGGDSDVMIIDNTIENNAGAGVSIDSKAVPYDDSAITIELNNFINNSTKWGDGLSVIADAGNYDGALVATNNWWNSASGPGGDGPGTGSSIYGDGYYVSGHQWVELTDGDAVFSPWSTVPINITATPSPAAPSQLTAAAVSTSQINLSWTDNAAGIENGFILQRSTDGLNYTQIATLAQGITTYADSSLSAGTTYYYRVEATSTYGDSAFSAAASAATISTSAIITNLSSLNWVSATTGYGSVQKNLSVNGNAITLKGVVYPSGISANAVANIVYNLGGAYTNFLATIGIDDEELTRGTGSVDFQVKGDGTLLYDSGILTNSSPAVSINVSVAGVQTLTLIANNGVPNTIDYDQGDWAGARLISSATQALVPPSNLIATDVSATQVNLSWTSTAANATGFVIQRSTDGVNFTTIATLASTSPTTYSDTTVAGSTTYYYQVLAADANAGLTSGASNIASVTTISASTITTNLSSLNWVSATTQYGSVQKNLSVNGNAITLKGVVYPSGISANAVANIVYNLAGAYTNFLATIGIDDEELNRGVGSVDFQVEGDGKLLYDSGVLTNSSPAVSINVSVAGVQTLTLVANNGVPNTIDYDQGDWAGARLLSTPQVPSAPTGLTAVTSSASQINLLWTAPTGTAAMGYLVQRSTDGVNFTTIASLGNVTNYFDKTAAAGTTYTYRILASNVVGNSLPSVTASATTLSSSAIVTNLSSLAWVSATIGYGSVQTNSTVAGNTLTLRGVTYSTGIGTHAVSNIVYNLNGAYTNFISDVGVDDEENGKGIGSVDFQVMGDGNLLFDSGVLTNNSPIVSLDVNVTGVKQLTLIATNGVANSIDYDHSDWAGARLISLPTVSPAVIIAAPAVEIATSKTESNSSNTLVSNASAVRAASRPALDVASQTPKAESVAIEPIRTAVHKKDQRLGLGVLKAVRQTVVIAGLEEFAPR